MTTSRNDVDRDVMALPWNRPWSPTVGTNEWKSGLDRRNCVTEILGLQLSLIQRIVRPGNTRVPDLKDQFEKSSPDP